LGILGYFGEAGVVNDKRGVGLFLAGSRGRIAYGVAEKEEEKRGERVILQRKRAILPLITREKK
jgi:hypothetical protein